MLDNGILSGERTNGEGKAISNRILLGLPDGEYRRLRQHLEYVDLPHHFYLHGPGRTVKFAYFLNGGLASVIVPTREGRSVEAGVAGLEGFVGTALIAGVQWSPLREQMQIAGSGFRIAARAFLSIVAECPVFQARMVRYAVLHGLQVAQTAACNRLHEVHQRLARWLLLAQDRLTDSIIPITHDFLAIMLGTDRPTVSITAADLQRRKVIEYKRGVIKVRNRKRLEAVACECYDVIRQFDGELGLR